MSITKDRVWKLSKRTFRKTTNEMHHLYNNRGIYWISLTFESIDDLSERRRINLKTDNKEKENLKATLLEAGKLLGILQQDPAKWLGYDVSGDAEVEKLLAERTKAKKAKNFKRADEIRDELKALGYAIEDTPEGPKARKIS